MVVCEIPVAEVIRDIKEDKTAPALLEQFYNAAENPLETRQ